MQFFAVVCALAAVATAAPSAIEARGVGGEECSARGYKQVCCNGIVGCAVQVLGSNCENKAYCCNTEKSFGGLVNIKALNCLDLLG